MKRTAKQVFNPVPVPTVLLAIREKCSRQSRASVPCQDSKSDLQDLLSFCESVVSMIVLLSQNNLFVFSPPLLLAGEWTATGLDIN